MLGKSFTPNHTKRTSSKGAFLTQLGTGTVCPKGLSMEGPFLLPFHSSSCSCKFSFLKGFMQLQLHCRLQSMSNRGARQTKKAEAFRKPEETFVALLTWPNSMNILVDLVLINTPSVPNYKSLQESWRVKSFQSLTKIIDRNTKIYDIK